MNPKDIPPDLTMVKVTLVLSYGALERARTMATAGNRSVDDCFEGWARKGDDEAIRLGLGELYDLQESTR